MDDDYTDDSTLGAAFQYSTNELRAKVVQGILGTKDDGDGSHGEPVLPLNYDKAPDDPSPTAGRCMLDGQPWDNHLGIMPQTGAFQCKGLYVQPSGLDREE